MHPPHETHCLICMNPKVLTPSLEKAAIYAGIFVREEGLTGFMDAPFRDLLVAEGQSRWFTP